MCCVRQGRKPYRNGEPRGRGAVPGEQLVTRRAIGGNGQPSHECPVGPDRNGNAIDAKRCVARPDSSKNEIGISHGDELLRLGIRHAYLQRTANFGNGRKLWIGRGNCRGDERSRRDWRGRGSGWSPRSRAGRTCERDATGKNPDCRSFHLKNVGCTCDSEPVYVIRMGSAPVRSLALSFPHRESRRLP